MKSDGLRSTNRTASDAESAVRSPEVACVAALPVVPDCPETLGGDVAGDMVFDCANAPVDAIAIATAIVKRLIMTCSMGLGFAGKSNGSAMPLHRTVKFPRCNSFLSRMASGSNSRTTPSLRSVTL